MPQQCKHKTPRDHSALGVGGVRVWCCTVCKKRAPWGPTWGYYGNYECNRCGWSNMHAVWCSDACCGAWTQQQEQSGRELNKENIG